MFRRRLPLLLAALMLLGSVPASAQLFRDPVERFDAVSHSIRRLLDRLQADARELESTATRARLGTIHPARADALLNRHAARLREHAARLEDRAERLRQMLAPDRRSQREAMARFLSSIRLIERDARGMTFDTRTGQVDRVIAWARRLQGNVQQAAWQFDRLSRSIDRADLREFGGPGGPFRY